jgi:hypothetical protein
MTRYEAWIFAFFILALFVNEIVQSERTSSLKLLLIISAVILIVSFPVYWIYLTTITSDNSTGFVSSVTNRYHEGNFIIEIKNNVLYKFLQINISSLNIIGLASILYLFKMHITVKKFAIIFFSTLITFSMLSFFIKAMPTHHYWRIAMIWSVLLLPFTVYWLYHLIENLRATPINKYLFVIFFIVLIYFFYSQTSTYTSKSYLTNDDYNVGEYLNSITTENDSKIYIMKDGADKWRFANILVTSQKPDLFIQKLEDFNYITSDTISISRKMVSELIEHGVKHIVIPTKVNVSDGQEYYSEVKTFDTWKVCKINWK